MAARTLLVASLLVGMSTPVYGQGFGRGFGGGGGNQGRSRGPRGTIQQIVPGGFIMSTRNGQTLNVLVTPATQVRLTGSATSDFIKPGFAVEFTAEVDKKHTVAEKVTTLTVVTLTSAHPAALLPGGIDSVGPAGAGNFGPVAGQSVEKHKAAGPVQLPATVVVRGQVKSYKGDRLVIHIDKGIVKADLADDAHVAVDIADFSQARKGDTVTVQGRGVRPGVVQADSVTVKAAAVLSGSGKKKPPKPPKLDKKPAAAKDGSDDTDAGD
jgi:hypothetical protein